MNLKRFIDKNIRKKYNDFVFSCGSNGYIHFS